MLPIFARFQLNGLTSSSLISPAATRARLARHSFQERNLLTNRKNTMSTRIRSRQIPTVARAICAGRDLTQIRGYRQLSIANSTYQVHKHRD